MSKTASRVGIPAGLVALVLLLGACSDGDAASNGDSTTIPTEAPTVVATEEPTVAATEEPTVAATEEPTVAATAEPTIAATEEPTVAATEEPTVAATEEPTVAATEEPTAEATEEPTAEATEEPTAEAEELFDGETAAEFYSETCSACHGANREGVVGPGLTPDLLVEDDAFYIDIVLNGLPGTAMPPWNDKGVSPEAAEALLAFFRTAP